MTVTVPFQLFDLTHTLTPDVPAWDVGCGFRHQVHHDYDPTALYQFRTHTIEMRAGMGTHMDAPAHCIAGGATIDQIELERLVVPAVVIDVRDRITPRYMVSVADIQEYEQEYGKVQPGAFVLIRTGWDQYWYQPQHYRNDHVFPSLSSDAATLLVERMICGIGIDTLSPDRPDQGFPVHQQLLGEGKYIVENVSFLEGELPPRGAFVLVCPLKIQHGTEAPVRLIGLQLKESL